MFGVTPCIIGDVTHIELMAVSGAEGQQRRLGRQGKSYERDSGSVAERRGD